MVLAICLLVSGFIAKLMGMSGLRASLGEGGLQPFSFLHQRQKWGRVMLHVYVLCLVGYSARTVLSVLGKIIALINAVDSMVLAGLLLQSHQPVVVRAGLLVSVYANGYNKRAALIEGRITRAGHVEAVSLFFTRRTVHSVQTQRVKEPLFVHASVSFLNIIPHIMNPVKCFPPFP